MKTKIGDIVFLDGEFVIVVNNIKWKKTPIKKSIPSGRWFKPDKVEETGEFKKELKEVWWDKLGIDDGIIHSHPMSNYYDWDDMRLKAVPLLRQAKIALAKLEEQEKEKNEATNS